MKIPIMPHQRPVTNRLRYTVIRVYLAPWHRPDPSPCILGWDYTIKQAVARCGPDCWGINECGEIYTHAYFPTDLLRHIER